MKISTYAYVQRLVGVLALAAMLVLAACKKDEPTTPGQQPGTTPAGETTGKVAPGETPTPAPTTPTEAPPAGQPTAETPAPPPATPTPETPTPATPTAPAPAAQLAPAAVQAVPGEIIAYGSLKSLDDLLTTVKDVAARVSPMPLPADIDQTMLMGLQATLGFQNMTWLDRTRPARIVVLNPKANPQPGVVVLPTTDPEAVKTALPVERKEGEAGNQYSYTHDFQTVYANIVGKDLVLTQSPESFAVVKAFVEANLANHTPTVPFEISVAMDNVLNIFGQELAMAEEQMSQLAAMPMALPVPGLQELVKKEYELLFSGVRQLQRIDIAFSAQDGRLRLPMTFTVKPEGGLARFIQAMAGRQGTLVNLLPAASYLVMAYNVDPKAAGEWTDLGFEFISKAFQMDAAKLASMRSLYDQSMDVTTGDTALALYRDGNFSFALDVLYGLNDAKKAREVQLAFYDALWTEIVTLIKTYATKEGAQIPPALDLSTFPKAIESLNAMVGPMGAAITLQKEEYNGVTLDILDLKLDFTKMPPMDPEEKAIVDVLVGDHLQFVLAYADTFLFESLGPNAVARAKQAIDGTKPLENDPSFATARDLLKDGGGVFFLDAVKGLQAFAAVPDLAPQRDAIMSKVPQGGLIVETDAVAGNQLRLTFDLATAPIGEMVKLFMGM